MPISKIMNVEKANEMALYSLDEICDGCKLSRWHLNDRIGMIFVECEEENEECVDTVRGICEYKDPIDIILADGSKELWKDGKEYYD